MNTNKGAFYFFNYGLVPFLLAFIAAVGLSVYDQLTIVFSTVFVVGGFASGIWAGRKTDRPLHAFLYPLFYTLGLWTLFMIISGGFYGADAWFWFTILHIPLAPVYFFSSLYGVGYLFIFIPVLYELAFFIGFLVKKQKLNVQSGRKTALMLMAVLFFAGIGLYITWERIQTVLPSHGFDYEGGNSSTDLTPYNVTNPNNILPKLAEEASFSIDTRQNMLVMDGAEAAFPVYSAFAQAVYKNAAQNSNFITFTNTIFAYERLVHKEVDIYFGAEPSKAQLKMADEAGVELVMTPIGKEAFVFFVNENNPVLDLSVEQIQSIYSGETTNWSEVGGKNKRILAFQRPENSGSQTWLQKIMTGHTIMTPVKEEVPEGMGGILEQVADYRNYKNSIGFSFRFFAAGMRDSEQLRFLSVNGVTPDPENISDELYPFTATLYAITLKENKKPSLTPFLDWMQGNQGQQLIEDIGYVKLKK
ncbi:PstS family phosphate ABC transporter substrate-binding protein [Domibacillus tundrae]|uniref:PstS family phosphate ABC transporter substrate-binding protein n=1 Tax=Domibacillus tundrae TaxID=1587527 RepID=UPI0033953E2E